MKYKTLRRIDTKEFIHIIGSRAYTCDIPDLLVDTVMMDDLLTHSSVDVSKYLFENAELIELDVNICGEIGADIRNKLTPMKNLVAILKNAVFLRNGDVKMQAIIKKEIKKCGESIKYISNLM